MKLLRSFFPWSLYAGLLLLHACATTPLPSQRSWRPYHQQPLAFNAEGRLSVRLEHKGLYSYFNWQIETRAYQHLSFTTPLGNTVAELCQDRSGARLSNSWRQKFKGKNIADLSQHLLGYDLPLTDLDLWVNGFIDSKLPYTVHGDQLEQAGWTITRFLKEDQLPSKIILTRPHMTITILFDHFSFLTPPSTTPSCQ